MVVEFASPSLILIPGCFEEAWRARLEDLGSRPIRSVHGISVTRYGKSVVLGHE